MPRPSALVLVLALLVAACSGAEPAELRRIATPPNANDTAEGLLQADDVVDLTLYFRAGEGQHAHLEPVIREVELDHDLPRHALELLLQGPAEGEEGVEAPLPTTTRLRDFRLDGTTAHVELSPEAIREAPSVGASPGNEALALAAIANTLTEFPSVEQVVVDVHGQGLDAEDFWGGWGLPGALVRDQSLIGPSPEGEGLVDLLRFAPETQTTGGDADEVEVRAVRVRDRLTHVRVTVELAEPGEPSGSPKVPRTRARWSGDDLVLELGSVADYTADMGSGRALELSSPTFEALAVHQEGDGLTVRVQTSDAQERPFWLHSLASPTRVILDIMK